MKQFQKQIFQVTLPLSCSIFCAAVTSFLDNSQGFFGFKICHYDSLVSCPGEKVILCMLIYTRNVSYTPHLRFCVSWTWFFNCHYLYWYYRIGR